MKKILIVEDEQHLADGLKYNLEAEGFDTAVCSSGEEALERSREKDIDAIVLDVMLPEMDGFEVARKLRERHDFTPILMLTALGRPSDVVNGFAAGADDYLAKPFDLNVFVARLNGLLRRASWPADDPGRTGRPVTVVINGRTIRPDTLELSHEGETMQLTLMEMKLLDYLVASGGRAVSRRQILEDVWGLQEDTDTRAIDNFIVRLRKYLEDDPSQPRILLTVRGIGYRFVHPDQRSK